MAYSTMAYVGYPCAMHDTAKKLIDNHATAITPEEKALFRMCQGMNPSVLAECMQWVKDEQRAATRAHPEKPAEELLLTSMALVLTDVARERNQYMLELQRLPAPHPNSAAAPAAVAPPPAPHPDNTAQVVS